MSAAAEVKVDTKLIAACGLYCGACKKHLKGKCPGCAKNEKASWCKVRGCCKERGYATCAECKEFPDPRECAKFNNLIARAFGLIFNSDRARCIESLRTIGPDQYAATMARDRKQSLPRR